VTVRCSSFGSLRLPAGVAAGEPRSFIRAKTAPIVSCARHGAEPREELRPTIPDRRPRRFGGLRPPSRLESRSVSLGPIPRFPERHPRQSVGPLRSGFTASYVHCRRNREPGNGGGRVAGRSLNVSRLRHHCDLPKSASISSMRGLVNPSFRIWAKSSRTTVSQLFWSSVFSPRCPR